MYKPGDKVVIVRGPYKGKTGVITELHKAIWTTNDPHYSVMLDEPATFTMPIAGGEPVSFSDHRSILSPESNIMLLTELGEALYGPSNDGSKTP